MNPTNRFQPTKEQLKSNYLAVISRIERAASAASRKPSDIQMVGVTKYVDANVARWLVELGCRALGESRPQSLWGKAEAISDLEVDWHLIGHLQRNKAKRTLPVVSVMHSVDSMRVLEQIQIDTLTRQAPLKLLLEMNISGDPSKTGMLVSEGERLLEHWQSHSQSFPSVQLIGLMGMGSLIGGKNQARTDFAELRNLRDKWVDRFGLQLHELSMGMSDDFEEAILEGSTMVRIGSILYS
jgi:PLP dependent protein